MPKSEGDEGDLHVWVFQLNEQARNTSDLQSKLLELDARIAKLHKRTGNTADNDSLKLVLLNTVDKETRKMTIREVKVAPTF